MAQDTNIPFKERLTVRRPGAEQMTGEGRSKIDELIAQGRLDARKSGKNLLITVASIEAYIASLPRAVLVSTGNYRKKVTADTPDDTAA